MKKRPKEPQCVGGFGPPGKLKHWSGIEQPKGGNSPGEAELKSPLHTTRKHQMEPIL